MQAYSKLYYDKKLKPVVEEAWEKYLSAHPDLPHTKGNKLRHRNELLQQLLEGESEEVKEEVNRRREEGISAEDIEEELEGDEEGMDPMERQQHAKALLFQRKVLLASPLGIS